MKNTRVLQVVGQLTLGGQETMVMNFYRHMDRKRINFDFVVYGDSVDIYEKEVEDLGGNVFHLAPLAKVGMGQFSKNFEKLIDSNPKYDVIHAHTSLNSGIVMKIASKKGVPIRITHSHTTKSGKKESVLFSFYKLFMQRLIRKYSTNIVACGKDAGNYLFGEEYFSNRGIVINNGIDIAHFKFSEEKRRTLRDKYDSGVNMVIGHVGRMSKEKNHIFLLRVFKRVCELHPQSQLLLIGKGTMMQEIETNCKKLNISDKVVFVGEQTNVNEILSAMDVFVFPSVYEGLPVSVIEAQASGLPCVVSDSITDEVCLTPLVHKLSLSDTIDQWATVIIGMIYNSRDNYISEIEKQGFDINAQSAKLVSIYLGE